MSNKGNKEAKRRLILKYGEVCFIEELGIRSKEDIDKEKRIRYTGKKQLAICDQLTYHHILERSKGGKATEENGALLRYINHQWFNRLSKEKQDEINKLFIEYKRQHSTKCDIEFVDKLDLGFEVKAMVFTPEELEKPKTKYNRAKDKREVERKLREWEQTQIKKENPTLDIERTRGKSHIDEEWQDEIAKDVIDEMRY